MEIGVRQHKRSASERVRAIEILQHVTNRRLKKKTQLFPSFEQYFSQKMFMQNTIFQCAYSQFPEYVFRFSQLKQKTISHYKYKR